jgi:hypothetical protein
VNVYAEPVYTLDADLVDLRRQGFVVEEHEHSVNFQGPGSRLRIQFTTDPRYQAFLERALRRMYPRELLDLIDRGQAATGLPIGESCEPADFRL